MAWKEVSAMDQRKEFVRLALLEGANRRELCRRFGISPPTGYKWLRRFGAGEVDCADRSRRPLSSPMRCAAVVEAAVLAVRDEHPAWGARKIAAWLENKGRDVPACSTVHAILVRHGRIVPPPGGDQAVLRFEAEAPNALWQMDFKGWTRLGNGCQLHPLTVIDDHSRFVPCLEACTDQTRVTVVDRLTQVFRIHGLPAAIFTDNGKPWGDSQETTWTKFGVWLAKLGIRLIHSRPYHPQSRGKNERFHRTLDDEVLAFRPLADLAQAQRVFDRWRHVYNFERPHGALDHKVPASRYHTSARPMPDKLREPEYPQGDIVRRVSNPNGHIAFKGRYWKVPKAFAGERVAIRSVDVDGRFGVFFASHRIATIDLTQDQTVSHVSEHPSTISPG
jgi:putative transposase